MRRDSQEAKDYFAALKREQEKQGKGQISSPSSDSMGAEEAAVARVVAAAAAAVKKESSAADSGGKGKKGKAKGKGGKKKGNRR